MLLLLLILLRHDERYQTCPASERMAASSFSGSRIVLLPCVPSPFVFLVSIVDDIHAELIVDFCC